MPKFTAFASERVYYATTFEAPSLEEAERMVYDNEIDFLTDHIEDSDGFDIQEIQPEDMRPLSIT